ncbi:MAG: HesA/MoeB/ThiF family protein [Verrucomicrobiota bacterium]
MSYLKRIAASYQDAHLSDEELSYYSRHLLLPGIGGAGQKKLKAARVLVVGAGGLGCPVLEALVGAGVGTITIVDADTVSMTNLARQWLYSSADVGASKVKTAKEVLSARNPFIRIETVDVMLDPENAEALIATHDLVVDATDTVVARYLIDLVCAKLDRPWVHGALYRGSGQVSVFWERCHALYAGLYPQKSSAPSCAGAGVLGVTASIIGNLEAQEVIKLITGNAMPSVGLLRIFDTTQLQLSHMQLPGITCPERFEAEQTMHDFSMDRDELEQRLSIGERFRITDLRPAESYARGHLPDAENVSLESLLSALPEMDPELDWILYCEEGSMSALLVDALRGRGYDKAYHLCDGYRALVGSY